MIKAFIPPEFLLEWFLKSLLPYIAKDVSTSGVQNEEQAIFRARQLDFIYAQSGLLYEIIPNAPRSNFDPKFKLGPHVNGIVGSASAKLARKLNLTFILLVPPSIFIVLVIIIGILIFIPTLLIIFFTLFSIPSGLLITLLVGRLHSKYIRCLGRLRRSRSLSQGRLVDRQLSNLFHN